VPRRDNSLIDNSIEFDQVQVKGAFPVTRWSLILDVQGTHTLDSREALGELCRIYWYPLYAYARRAGNSPEDAEDITQGFLAGLLERDGFGKTHRDKGKLRSFLLASLKNHMRDEWRKSQKEKRGAGVPVVSINIPESEAKYASFHVDKMTSEVAYDRFWVFALLEEVMKELGAECERNGKIGLLSKIGVYLNAEADDRCPYRELASEFGLSESGMRVAVHRMRSRYRQLLREKISDTLSASDDFEVELNYLMGIFGKS